MPLYEVTWDYGHSTRRGMARVVADGPFQAALEAGRRVGKNGLNGQRRLLRRDLEVHQVDTNAWWKDGDLSDIGGPVAYEVDNTRSVDVSFDDRRALAAFLKGDRTQSIVVGRKKELIATSNVDGGAHLVVYGK